MNSDSEMRTLLRVYIDGFCCDAFTFHQSVTVFGNLRFTIDDTKLISVDVDEKYTPKINEDLSVTKLADTISDTQFPNTQDEDDSYDNDCDDYDDASNGAAAESHDTPKPNELSDINVNASDVCKDNLPKVKKEITNTIKTKNDSKKKTKKRKSAAAKRRSASDDEWEPPAQPPKEEDECEPIEDQNNKVNDTPSMCTNKDVSPYQCPICRKTFKNKAGVASHVNVHATEGNDNFRLVASCDNTGDLYQCMLCDQAYPSKKYLNRHIKVHITNPRKVCCKQGGSKKLKLSLWG